MRNPNFAHFQRATLRALLERVRYCEAQTEAARELLAKAEEIGAQKLEFWREALEFAEEEEATARRNVAQFQARDAKTAHRRFDFERALLPATQRRFNLKEAA